MGIRVFDESFRKMAIELSYTKGSVREVADELGISQTILSKWRQRESDSSKEVAELTEDQKLIKKPPKRAKRCPNGTRYFKKDRRHLFQGRREIFGFIREYRRIFAVEMMCRVFRVSNSGFCYWLNHPKGKRQVEMSFC